MLALTRTVVGSSRTMQQLTHPDRVDAETLAGSCFDGLDSLALQALLRAACFCSVAAGDYLMREGARDGATLYVILDGTARIHTCSPGGRVQVLALAGRGDIVADAVALVGGVCQASADALEPVTALAIPATALREIMQQHPDVALTLLHLLAEQQRQLLQIVRNLAFRRVLSRTATLLLDADVTATLNQSQMAAMIGTRREVFNRALQRLARLDLIEVNGHLIMVLDPEGLQLIAEAG
jgi:CRP/FNR family transcriptional regulator